MEIVLIDRPHCPLSLLPCTVPFNPLFFHPFILSLFPFLLPSFPPSSHSPPPWFPPSFPSSFTTSFPPSFLPSFLPSFPSFPPSVLPSFPPSLLPSFLPSFLLSFPPSFLPSFLPFLLLHVSSCLNVFFDPWKCFFWCLRPKSSKNFDAPRLSPRDAQATLSPRACWPRTPTTPRK